MIITAVILEDEPIARRRLERLLSEQGKEEVQVLATFGSVQALVDWSSSENQPDVYFLDISVSDGNAFQLFDLIDIHGQVVFTTAHQDHALEAFQVGALDYLLKPIRPAELERALHRVKERMKGKEGDAADRYPSRFMIRFANRLYQLETSELAYIYSEDKLSFFVTKEGKRVPSDIPLQDLESRLDPSEFFRANRQAIVHRDGLKEIIRHTRSRLRLVLTPPHHEDLIVSTENTPRFKEWLA